MTVTYAQLRKDLIWVGYEEDDLLRHVLTYRMLPHEVPRVNFCPNLLPPVYKISSEYNDKQRVIAIVNRLLIDSNAINSYKIDQSIKDMITVVVNDET